MQNVVEQLIEEFLEKYEELWQFQPADNITEFTIELGLEDYLLAHGIKFTSIDVNCGPILLTIDVHGEFEEIDYLSITRDIIKGA